MPKAIESLSGWYSVDSYSKAVLAAALILSGLLCLRCAEAAVPDRDAASGYAHFQQVHGRIVEDQEEALAGYLKVRSIYYGLSASEKRQAGQLLSALDAMFGRYEEAQGHYYESFPTGAKPGECPSGMKVVPAVDTVVRIARDADFLLINESHSVIGTRAFVFRLLPRLRALGFRYLALEALFPAQDQDSSRQWLSIHDHALVARGYPLDQSAAGFYLREPLYAEIVREAISLGFTLVAYDSGGTSREEREVGQAGNLARILEADPDAKVLVIAGYSHIWKTDGWMADRLQKLVRARILSIDQTSRMAGCKDIRANSLEPYVLETEGGAAWASRPDRVDLTVIHPIRKDGRSAQSGWLTLGGIRKAVPLDTTACGEAWPCLISAIRMNESVEAVPADRVLLDGPKEMFFLFLKPGTYRYVVQPYDQPKVIRRLIVREAPTH
jgi:hypothetical protein